nr:cbb3-type cytochrome c oxidase subunit I [Siccirubricoccus sp. G192]
MSAPSASHGGAVPAERRGAAAGHDLPYRHSPGPDGAERLKRAWAMPRITGIFTEPNNTWIGGLYIATGFCFFLAAGVLALVMRLQLAVPGAGVLDAATFNQFFTMHGTTMMFLFAVPIVEAFAVMLLPSLLGTRDMPFPWLSAFGYWCYAIGGTLVFVSPFFGIAPDGGWFMYPPLTGPQFSPGINTDVWILGLGFVEISAVAAAVELTVGILKTRAPGMTLAKMPIFAWYMLVTAAMIMIGMPAVIAADILLELERAFGWPFYDATQGGDPLLWQHLFWLFGQPRQLRPHRARLRGRRLYLRLDQQRAADRVPPGPARDPALGPRLEAGGSPVLRPHGRAGGGGQLDADAGKSPERRPDLPRRLWPAAAAHHLRLPRERPPDVPLRDRPDGRDRQAHGRGNRRTGLLHPTLLDRPLPDDA